MNSPRLFVGNLPFDTSEDHIREMFESCGAAVEVTLPKDRESGRSRGFAFVTMGSTSDAQKAAQQLDGSELGGRSLRVNEAEARRERSGERGGGRQRR